MVGKGIAKVARKWVTRLLTNVGRRIINQKCQSQWKIKIVEKVRMQLEIICGIIYMKTPTLLNFEKKNKIINRMEEMKMNNEKILTMPRGAHYVTNDECEYVDGAWDDWSTWKRIKFVGTIVVGIGIIITVIALIAKNPVALAVGGVVDLIGAILMSIGANGEKGGW